MSMSSNDLLRCGICKHLFSNSEHKPKFLHCHHSYCEQCLISIQCKRKAADGGGVEFTCPYCQKVTRVGKRGIEVLQDNFYILSLSAAIKDDDVYQSDEESGAKNSYMVTAWCNTCFKLAGAECSTHDICNLEEGKRHLSERMQTVMLQTEEELKQELKILEPHVAELQAARSTLDEQINTQHESLAIATSELESLKMLQTQLEEETNLENVVTVLKKTEMIFSNSQKRATWVSKQADGWTSLNNCHIIISTSKMNDLSVNITGSNLVEKQISFWLSQLLHIKELDDATWEQVNKGSKKVRNNSGEGSGYNSLLSTPALSTESLAKAQTALYKEPGRCTRCFFDISVNSELKGRFVIELRPDIAPKMCANFVALCTGDLGYGYKGSKIFKALANDHIIGGDFIKNDGSGGHSIYNNKKLFVGDRSTLQDEKGAVRMRGMGTDGMSGGGMVGSQFHIWVGDRDFRTYKRTLVFGFVVEGLELCKMVSNLKTYKNSKGTYIIGSSVIIENCGKL